MTHHPGRDRLPQAVPYRFDGPRMAESWVTYDQRGLLQQIGALAA